MMSETPPDIMDAAWAAYCKETSSPTAAVKAAIEAAAAHLVAAERMGLCEVLSGHYLANITCDHERKMDRPECACSLVDLGWHQSVGEAVQAWIRHVMWQRSAQGTRPDEYDPA